MTPADRKVAIKVKDSDFDASADDDEPTTHELVEMLRESIQQANSEETRPLNEVLEELRQQQPLKRTYPLSVHIGLENLDCKMDMA